MKINFGQLQPLSKLVYDHTLASDPSKIMDLAIFVRTYYRQNWDDWTSEDFDQSWRDYQNMITTAIKSNNTEGIEILWDGIYYHDRSNPDYEFDVYTAVEFGNLETVKCVLNGYMNYATLNGVEDLEYSRLQDLANANSDKRVFDLIQALACCLTPEAKLPCLGRFLLQEEDEDLETDKALAIKYYQTIDAY